MSIAPLCAAIAIVWSAAGDAGAEQAASNDWRHQPYPYLVVDQALSETFAELGRNLGIAIEVSDGAGGKRVRRHEHDGSSGDFLDRLAADHDLDWVFRGGRLAISSQDERITRAWSGGAGALESAQSALAKTGVSDPRYPIGAGGAPGELSLSAPPRYMALAAPVIERALAPKTVRTVNVFHGRARKGGT